MRDRFLKTGAIAAAAVGVVGLRATYAAIELGKDIALANKEVLVAAGEVVMAAVARRGDGDYADGGYRGGSEDGNAAHRRSPHAAVVGSVRAHGPCLSDADARNRKRKAPRRACKPGSVTAARAVAIISLRRPSPDA